MSGIIYLITNTSNGKRYVGKTVCAESDRFRRLNRRWSEHIAAAIRGKGHHLAAAIRKYGNDRFAISEIAYINGDGLNQAEIYYISEYNTFAPIGYNLTRGGEGCSGFSLPAKTREKIRAALLGHEVRSETREKLRGAHAGRPSSFAGHTHSTKTRRRLSEAHNRQGNINTKGTTSTFVGVYWSAQLRKWRAQISVNRRRIHLGCFVNERDAASAYDRAAVLHYGVGAKLNEVSA